MFNGPIKNRKIIENPIFSCEASLSYHNKELVRRIYEEEIRNPSMDDFIELLKRNFQTISEGQDDKKIGNTTKITYKKYIKNYIRNASLNLQSTHSKVREMKYKQLETQKYMISPIFTNEEVSILHTLRPKKQSAKQISYRN